MRKFTATTIAISMLLIAGGCTPNNQTAMQQPTMQQQRCTVGDQHPWCMQLVKNKSLGSQDSTVPVNPEMQEDVTPMPFNHALQLTGPGMGPLMGGRY